MNRREQTARRKWRRDGWTVIRAGWPDFLCLRSRDGVIEAKGVEVKAPNDTVRPHQARMHNALRKAGLQVVIEQDEIQKREVRDKGASSAIFIRIPVDMRREIERLAHKDERTLSSMMKILIEEGLELLERAK